VSKLSPGAFFEGRILLPKSAFYRGSNDDKNRQTIIEEEDKYIRDTIEAKKRDSFLTYLLVIASIVVFLSAGKKFVTNLINFWKYQREEKLPSVNLSGRIWEPPSNIDPAQVEQLLTARKYLTPKSFTATILSLVQISI
jgi:hypothetical protein